MGSSASGALPVHDSVGFADATGVWPEAEIAAFIVASRTLSSRGGNLADVQ